ncbi:MAG TPA: family 10 glycosylhydrolase, partial [Gemmatimonadaceae bacterium]|nr:family 10 glycosylhydrolase [Gemmatimonadaceae bacterium]
MRLAHLIGIVVALGVESRASAQTPPPIDREFRAVWIATVGNIDWPSKPGLSTWDQQRELLAILDRAVALKLNAVIFQVRPGADAFFASTLEPWSQY